MDKNQLKQFALATLDDEHGLNEKSWNILESALLANHLGDISVCVVQYQSRFFLEEGEAERLAAL